MPVFAFLSLAHHGETFNFSLIPAVFFLPQFFWSLHFSSHTSPDIISLCPSSNKMVHSLSVSSHLRKTKNRRTSTIPLSLMAPVWFFKMQHSPMPSVGQGFSWYPQPGSTADRWQVFNERLSISACCAWKNQSPETSQVALSKATWLVCCK